MRLLGRSCMGAAMLTADDEAGRDRANRLIGDRSAAQSRAGKDPAMKATPANRPFIAQRLTSQLGTLGAVAAGPAAANENRRQSQPVATLPPPRVAARPALPPASGVWGRWCPVGL